MVYKKYERHIPVCLECGDQIRYGRTDKKFCCDTCRAKYNNANAIAGRAYKRRVMGMLEKNYDILDTMLRSDITSVELVELVNMGFVPGVVTSYHKVGRHDEYSCFDIKYIMTPSRVYGIKKISLNLRVGKNNKKL